MSQAIHLLVSYRSIQDISKAWLSRCSYLLTIRRQCRSPDSWLRVKVSSFNCINHVSSPFDRHIGGSLVSRRSVVSSQGLPSPSSLPLIHSLYDVYDVYDKRLDAHNEKKYCPFPISPPGQRRYSPRDVSLVVPTVDMEPTFVACLETWARCRPGEILVVTTEAQAAGVYELLSLATGINRDSTRIQLLTIEKPNKRHQLIRGIQAARGEILALVDDDVRWESDETLTSLLAPFEEEDVRLVGGPVECVFSCVTYSSYAFIVFVYSVLPRTPFLLEHPG